jgi:hypothetical protein
MRGSLAFARLRLNYRPADAHPADEPVELGSDDCGSLFPVCEKHVLITLIRGPTSQA